MTAAAPTFDRPTDKWGKRPRWTADEVNAHRELVAALAALLDAEWMVTCDWTNPDKREPILAEGRRVLGRNDD